MLIDNSADVDDNVKIAVKLLNEFLVMDPEKKSKLDSGFIRSIIEPFLGKREQFTKLLQEEASLV